ncbi:MAG: RNA polymerase sigma factor [Deltaproteobacteria bacterium]|nr:RNA polymerase sigma factor [Deltaproteobacteria bacterium]
MNPALQREALGGDDEALLARVAAGDASALGHAFERWHRDVYRFLSRLRGTRLDLDDLVQTTFLALPLAAVNHRPDGSARAFVLGVALQHARRERRRILRRFALWQARREELGDALDARDPERVAGEREALARFSRALAALPEAQREALLLVEVEGLRGEDAAAAMGVPVNTVWTRLHHARSALRRAVRPEEAP